MGNGTLAHVEEFESLDALQSFLQPQIDEIMRNRYPYLSKASSSGSTRVAEERHNVSVVACLHAVKHESGPHGENDFHVMLGNGTTPGEGIFLTAEASGLPPDGPHRALLLQAREELLSVIGPCRCNGHFMAVLPPIQVRVTGSLCFDGDHVGSTGNEARAASTHRRRASRAKREATLA